MDSSVPYGARTDYTFVGGGIAKNNSTADVDIAWYPGAWGQNATGENVIPLGGDWKFPPQNYLLTLRPGEAANFYLNGLGSFEEADAVAVWNAASSPEHSPKARWYDGEIMNACAAPPVTVTNRAPGSLP
ncbi:MAG: hypothetical protein LH624_03955 [Cryobacterium sp.]|nr:hypothetical protein [Cryobacterium sp.]